MVIHVVFARVITAFTHPAITVTRRRLASIAACIVINENN